LGMDECALPVEARSPFGAIGFLDSANVSPLSVERSLATMFIGITSKMKNYS
jgi:hypothetical protein